MPLLGALVLLGVIANMALGFASEAGYASLVMVHMGIGYLGLLLVLVAAVMGWQRRGKVPTRNILAMTVVLVLAIVQVYLGSQLLESSSQTLLLAHEANAFLLLAGVLVTAALTARRQAAPKP